VSSLKQPGPVHVSESTALVDVLRQALASGTHSADSILRAATDAARILTDAQGTALALRTNEAIICRARSGDIAPELGAPLNVDSGISGECLRTATILYCSDTTTDVRVDPEVCRTLGIRSMVVVPLRGAAGVAGILEAFSIRAHAFGDEQIDSLRALAEIAEAAYDRESRSQRPAPASLTPAANRPALFAPPGVTEETRVSKFSDDYSPERRYWIPGVVVLGLLLVALVAWFSWRGPAAEIAASEPPARPVSTPEETPGSPAPRVVPLKPDAAVAGRQSDRLRTKDVLQNAADIQPATGGSHSSSRPTEISLLDRAEKASVRPASPSLDSEPPPSVEVTTTTTKPDALSNLGSAPSVLPALGVRISQGITNGNLIRRVDPVYPPQARMHRLAGSVTLDAIVGEDGSIRSVKVVGGPPLLVGAATAAVHQWRYSPSTLSGKPIEVQKRITIVFTLP